MLKVEINGVEYANVGNIEPIIEERIIHDVETLDGVRHKEVAYVKTNQQVTFFNLLDGVYVFLREYIKAHKATPIKCGFMNDEGEYERRHYYLTVKSEKVKGIINGKNFKNGLVVLFEAVNPDE